MPHPLAGQRAHLWTNGVCRRCCMRTHWEGAKDGCTGVMLEEEHRERQRRYEANRRERGGQQMRKA